jgi:hypothetical protein
MDRFLIGFLLCACICLTPAGGERGRQGDAAAGAPERTERAFFSVLYPQWIGLDEAAQAQDVEWYSAILSFLREVAA